MEILKFDMSEFKKKLKNPQISSLMTDLVNDYLSKFYNFKSVDELVLNYEKKIKYFKTLDKKSKLIFYIGYIDDIPVCFMTILFINQSFLSVMNKKSLKENAELLNVQDKCRITYGMHLYVGPAIRKKGICKKFLSLLIKDFTKQKINYFITDIVDDNIPSIKCHIYNKFVSRLPSFFKNSHTYVRVLDY